MQTLEEFLKEFPTATAIYNEQGQCIELYCSDYPSLTSIPQLNNLQILDCSYCASFTSIPQLDNLETLYCFNCASLTSIPQLDNLQILNCSYCASLTSIPQLDNLQRLNCSNCASLTFIPQLDNLQRLNCSNCASLTSIPQLDNLQRLDCSNCVNLDFINNEKWIDRWQELGLMPRTKDGGYILWKHVSPELKGNLNFQYEIGKKFKNNGMACAGPFGTLQEYNKYPDNSHLIAIKALKISPADKDKGIYYIYEGIPLALYSASNISNEGADLKLIKGKEIKEILHILER